MQSAPDPGLLSGVNIDGWPQIFAVPAPHHLRNVCGGLAQQKRFHPLRCLVRIFRVAGFKICQRRFAADVFLRHLRHLQSARRILLA